MSVSDSQVIAIIREQFKLPGYITDDEILNICKPGSVWSRIKLDIALDNFKRELIKVIKELLK